MSKKPEEKFTVAVKDPHRNNNSLGEVTVTMKAAPTKRLAYYEVSASFSPRRLHCAAVPELKRLLEGKSTEALSEGRAERRRQLKKILEVRLTVRNRMFNYTVE